MNSDRSIPPKTHHFILLLIFVIFLGRTGSPSFARDDQLRFHFINVGYGDAVVIEHPDGHHVMIDAGERAFAPHVVAYLQDMSIGSIATAVITHPHKNHFEGFAEVLKTVSIGRVLINGDDRSEEGYEELLETFGNKNIPVETIRQGSKIGVPMEGFRIDVLHPKELSGTPNGNSLVLLVRHHDISVLLTGDIGIDEQKALIQRYPDKIPADIVKAPHHGGPLSEDFKKIFSDKTIIISTGENRWGIPNNEEIDQWGGPVYRTDHHGTIVVHSDGKDASVTTEK